VYGWGFGIPEYVVALASGSWVCDLAIAAFTLASLLGLMLWCGYRKRRAARPAGPVHVAPPNSPNDINREARRRCPADVAFDVRLLVQRGTRRCAARARAKGLRFTTAVSEDVPQWVRGNPSRIGLVFRNLLDNSVHFTDEGAVRLEVAAIGGNGGRIQLRYSVYDTGAGIDSETLAQLLKSNVSSDRRAHHGLAASRLLVAQMGGTIGAESEPRGGSTFWFTAEVEAVKPPQTTLQRRGVPANPMPRSIAGAQPLLPRASSPGKRVLIVEHELAQQVALLWGVQALGYSGEVVSSVQAVLEVWQRAPFDLVLLECAMHDAGGITKGIRGLETGCIPIVGMSGTADEPRICRAAVDDHLPKPVCLVELARTLHHWLADAAPAYASDASSDKLSLPV
jgi:CheY-like chemotaxis protein